MTRRRGILLVALAIAACTAPEADVHSDAVGDGPIGVARAGLPLSSLAGSMGCSTAGTEGISGQLIAEMLCLAEGRLVMFSHPNIHLTSSRVHPYLSPAGRDMIMSVAASHDVSLNSTLRTIAEQYVLFHGCSVAAQPGRSNHETGKAIDVDNYGTVGGALVAAGFTHPLPDTDPVHYEAPGDDLRNLSILSFQRLWNVNHPEDVIAEDGVVGPMTLGRLEMSPAEGFPMGGRCGACTPSTEVCDGMDNDCDGMTDEDGVCAPPPVDAGPPPPPPPTDAGPTPGSDAGTPRPDAGAAHDAGSSVRPDAAPDDGGQIAHTTELGDAGCGCHVAGHRRTRASGIAGVIALLCVLGGLARRRRR